MAKRSQEAVHYRDGFPTRRCGWCEHFMALHRCSKVESLVAAHKLCDLYMRRVSAGTVLVDPNEISIVAAKRKRWAAKLAKLKEMSEYGT